MGGICQTLIVEACVLEMIPITLLLWTPGADGMNNVLMNGYSLWYLGRRTDRSRSKYCFKTRRCTLFLNSFDQLQKKKKKQKERQINNREKQKKKNAKQDEKTNKEQRS